MQAWIAKTVLTFLTKKGLQALMYQIAKSSMFQEFLQGLILERVKGVQDKYPETYASIEAYTIALSHLPAIFTDDNPNNLEQVAQEFRVKQVEQIEQLEDTFADVQNRGIAVLTNAKKVRVRLEIKDL